MKLLVTIILAGLSLHAAPQQARGSAAQGEERVLTNGKLRVHVRANLTVSVEDLVTNVTWGSDPWENSAGRVHLRGKHGETINVSLGSAGQKKIDAISPPGADGVQFSLEDFRSRLGPVRNDRDPGARLSLVLQVLVLVLPKGSERQLVLKKDPSDCKQLCETELFDANAPAAVDAAALGTPLQCGCASRGLVLRVNQL
jgi:hypothetical protein